MIYIPMKQKLYPEIEKIVEDLKAEWIEVKIEEIKKEINDIVLGCSCGWTWCWWWCWTWWCGWCSCRIYSKGLNDDKLKAA